MCTRVFFNYDLSVVGVIFRAQTVYVSGILRSADGNAVQSIAGQNRLLNVATK